LTLCLEYQCFKNKKLNTSTIKLLISALNTTHNCRLPVSRYNNPLPSMENITNISAIALGNASGDGT
jgi:hypothetical protein